MCKDFMFGVFGYTAWVSVLMSNIIVRILRKCKAILMKTLLWSLISIYL